MASYGVEEGSGTVFQLATAIDGARFTLYAPAKVDAWVQTVSSPLTLLTTSPIPVPDFYAGLIGVQVGGVLYYSVERRLALPQP